MQEMRYFCPSLHTLTIKYITVASDRTLLILSLPSSSPLQPFSEVHQTFPLQLLALLSLRLLLLWMQDDTMTWRQPHLRGQCALLQRLLSSPRFASSAAPSPAREEAGPLCTISAGFIRLHPEKIPAAYFTANWKTHIKLRPISLTREYRGSKLSGPEEQRKKTQNCQGQTIWNQARSQYLDSSLLQCNLIFILSPYQTTTNCQIRHFLLRLEYYGCKKAFNLSWVYLQSNK